MRKLLLILGFLASPALAQVGPVGPTPQAASSAALEASHVFKASPGSLYYATATTDTGAAGFFVCVNATSISAGAIVPLDVVVMPVGPSTATISFGNWPATYYSTGITCAVTVAATPFTFTSGGSLFFYKAITQ